ncbi:MAG TPA: hypothetical protein VGM90_30455 [Kofleriaceae bacterium]|jgi:hypothetical protein
MRRRVFVVSFAVHGVLAVLLVSLAVHPSPPPRSSVSIEMIAAPPEPAIEPAPAVTPTRETSAPTRKRGGSSSRGASAHVGSQFIDPRGDVHYETGDEGGAGQGNGHGSGIGSGLGIEDVQGSAAVARLSPPPAPAKISQARPAILIYPKKHGADDDPAIFVAQVTIDDEGFVVGAHVMHGEGGPRGQQASDLIWRFRYDPARDDDGRPIRSTLEQPFLVGR